MIDDATDMIRGRHLRVVLPEGRDPRVPVAARRLLDEDLAVPIVIGTAEAVASAADEAAVDLRGVEVVDPTATEMLDHYAQQYCKRRSVDESIARRIVRRPLFYGGMMLAEGDADAMIAGAATATAMVIQAGVLTVGLAEGITVPSSFFVMLIPGFRGEDRYPLVFADCAVNISPGAEELADIAIASASSARRLLGSEPRVAMLSFSTLGSAQHPDVQKVRDAVRIIREKEPALLVDGELQGDTALMERVARKKLKRESAVAGEANVLIFPDLDAGNIAYKLTQYLAQAEAIGPFLQGFAKPLSDLSRGATVEDIVKTTTITLAQV